MTLENETRPLVTTIAHKGREYWYDGKCGKRIRNGATVFEFRWVEPPATPAGTFGAEYRLWAKADGSEIEED